MTNGYGDIPCAILVLSIHVAEKYRPHVPMPMSKLIIIGIVWLG